MKKRVNGKVIEIDNIGLFESAFEGLALGRLVSSSVSDTITDDSELINECISAYDSVYKLLPFPLYAVEQDIKYSLIATVIKGKLNKAVNMWIDGALYVKIDTDKSLKFISNTWGIVSVDGDKHKDNTDMQLYSEDVGYSEFSWALKKLENNKSLNDYYTKFMPEFVKACNNEPMVLKWELTKMLDFGPVPERMTLKTNKILDIDTGSEFLIDIFSTGKKKIKDSEYVLDMSSKGSGLRKQPKYIQTYDFEVFEKKKDTLDISNNSGISRLRKSNLDGFAGVFETLIGRGILRDNMDSLSYEGILIDNKIVYQVGNQIFVCNSDRYIRPVEIGRNVNIYSYDKGFVYIIKKNICDSGVCRESVYALNPKDMQVRLCKIQFI